ncbi:MAG: hypothetical protein K2N81_13240 [Acetatifactor sp.]|nr:hypothetical protein [Acetatifactor sp.]
MDKYEYKVRAESIRELIAQRDYIQAAEIADTIDWRRVKSVMMLCTISDLYKINRRYEDARDLLLLAYERRPGGRNICYSLCELSIKTGEFVQAMEYYKEFVRVAPKDPGRYILQYKLYEDQDVSLEERIEVLEDLKKHDYREKWAYELAYLYHRVGLATRCVEECDEMILWFGEGEYVVKAMELKMLHQPLSAEQQEKYDHRFDMSSAESEPEDESELFDGQYMEDSEAYYEEMAEQGDLYEAEAVSADTQIFEPVKTETGQASMQRNMGAVAASRGTAEPEEQDIQVKTMDVGQYNTLNLQAELAQELKNLLSEEQKAAEETTETAETIEAAEITEATEPETFSRDMGIDHPITRSIVAPMMNTDMETMDSPESDDAAGEDLESEAEEMESSEVFFGETGEIVLAQMRQEATEKQAEKESEEAEKQAEKAPEETVEKPMEKASEETAGGQTGETLEELPVEQTAKQAAIAQVVHPQNIVEKMAGIQPPKELAHVLSQEPDGQLSLVVPERENVEKQITGQMNIGDVLAEWERMKQENEEKRREDVRQHVLQQTGRMFTDFDAAVKDGLLEKLEKSVDEPETAGELGEEPIEEEALQSEEEELPQTEPEEQPEEETAQEELKEEPEGQPEQETSQEELKEEPEGQSEEETSQAEAEEQPEEETSETEPEEQSEEQASKAEPVEESSGKERVRAMTREERELYSAYIQSRSTKDQIVKAVDNISLAAYTGNVIITGEAGMDTLSLAKKMIREVQSTDSNFSGKVAKISGKGLSAKNVEETLNQLQNGALIIQNACDMDGNTVQDLYKTLQKESLGIVVLLQDDTRVMNRFLKKNEKLLDVFTARVDVEALSNDLLVAYGKKYAREQEYSIDELGVLALHNRIEQRQTLDHAVTTSEVKEIVDGAIRHANRKTPRHFFDILLAKRYDEEDMIVVTEKDFA